MARARLGWRGRREGDGQGHEQAVRAPGARGGGREDGRVLDRGARGLLDRELEQDRALEVLDADRRFVLAQHADAAVRSFQHAGALGARRRPVRALGVELAQHGRADGDVSARVERALERLAEGIDPRRGNLEKAEQWPASPGHELPAARGRLLLGLRRRDQAVRRGGGVHEEVGVLVARTLGNGAHESVVGRVQAAGQDGR